MTDLLPDRQTIRVPVEDTGQGEDHLYITITSGDLTHEALLKVLGTLSKAKAPVHVSIEPQAPPILVTVQRAAEITGTTPTYIRALIAAGHLKPVHWSDKSERQGRTSVEVADTTGNFAGWSVSVKYDELVELITKARERGRLPMPLHSRPPASRYRVGDLRQSTASLTRQAVSEATNVDGEYQWLTVSTVYRRVMELNDALPPPRRVARVSRITVGDALRKAEKRGAMEVRVAGYDPDNPKASGKALEYRWRPPATDEEKAAEAAAEYERLKPAGWVEVTPELPTEERLLLRAIEQGDDELKARLRELLVSADDGAGDAVPDIPPPRSRKQRRPTVGSRPPRAKKAQP